MPASQSSAYWPPAWTTQPCRQAAAMAICAVRLEHSVTVHDLLAKLIVPGLGSQQSPAGHQPGGCETEKPAGRHRKNVAGENRGALHLLVQFALFSSVRAVLPHRLQFSAEPIAETALGVQESYRATVSSSESGVRNEGERVQQQPANIRETQIQGRSRVRRLRGDLGIITRKSCHIAIFAAKVL